MEGKPQWLIMVYLAGDNNLGTAMTWAIKEIYRTYDPNKGVDVVVQFDPSAVGPHIRRYDLRQTMIGPCPNGQIQQQALPTEEDGFLETWKNDVTEPPWQRYWPMLTFDEKCNPIEPGIIRNPRTKTQTPERREPEEIQKPGTKSSDDIKKKPVIMPILEQYRRLPSIEAVGESRYIRRLLEVGRYYIENSADPKVLLQFMRDCVCAHDPEHIMLVLSGHGSGAIGDFLTDDIPQQLRTDHDLPCSLSIPHLGMVLDQFGRRIDILGMDSCLMSMAEVCAEVHDSVSYLVGAEGMGLNLGWPYRKILPIFYSDSGIPGVEAKAKEIVQRYIRYYSDYQAEGVSADHAALNLSSWPKLEPLIDVLAQKMMDALSRSKIVSDYIVLAHWRCQSYKYDQYVDLWDFCHCLDQLLDPLGSQLVPSSDVTQTCMDLRQCCRNVKKAVDDLVSVNGWSGAEYQHSHGLSIYFPWNYYVREYNGLKLARNTCWDAFLYKYVGRTMAAQRDLHCPSGTLHEEASIEPQEDWLSRFGHEGRPKFGAEGRPKGTGRAWSMGNPPKKFYRCRRIC